MSDLVVCCPENRRNKIPEDPGVWFIFRGDETSPKLAELLFGSSRVTHKLNLFELPLLGRSIMVSSLGSPVGCWEAVMYR